MFSIRQPRGPDRGLLASCSPVAQGWWVRWRGPRNCFMLGLFWILWKQRVSDVILNGLFPLEPEHNRGPKLKVTIIGGGLIGMSTAVELLDQGREVGADKNLLAKEHTHTFVNKSLIFVFQ